MGDYLAEVFNGHVSAYYQFFPDGPLTRVHYIIGRDEGATPKVDQASLEKDVGEIVRTWSDGLAEVLAETHDPGKARALFAQYRDAFSDGYREAYTPREAVADIRVIEQLSPEHPLGVDFYGINREAKQCVGLKVWSHRRPIPLSERVPVLENMGFKVVDERTYHHVMESGGWASTWFLT